MSNKGVELQKRQNVKRILRIIRSTAAASKAEVCTLTGLSFATVSSICNDLVSKNILLEESIPASGTLGRTPMRLSIRRSAFFTICLDIQNLGTIDVYIQDLCGQIVSKRQIAYQNPLQLDDILCRLREEVSSCMKALCIEREQVIGLGASVSGIFDLKTETIEACAIEQWDGLNLKQRLVEIFLMPVYVDNEANLYASQLNTTSTNPHERKNMVYLHIGEGIGVGVLIDGHLLRGQTGYAAEISHLPIGDHRLQCSRCGGYGCAETELSKAGFLHKYARISGKTDPLQWSDFVRLANERDLYALRVLRENGDLIADCIITLLMLFDPQELHIGGSIIDVYPLIEHVVCNRAGRLGHHYANIPLVLETNPERALVNGITEMLIERWEI